MVEIAGKVRGNDNVSTKLVRNAVPGWRRQRSASELFSNIDRGTDILPERSCIEEGRQGGVLRSTLKMWEDVDRGVGMDAVVRKPSVKVQGAPMRRDPEVHRGAREGS